MKVMRFNVTAYAEDHALTTSVETAREAFAKAVEWHVVGRLSDIAISDGTERYSIDEFSSLIGSASQSLDHP